MKRIFTRRRKGQPTGGQFAPQQRHEAGLSLAEDRALTQSQAELADILNEANLDGARVVAGDEPDTVRVVGGPGGRDYTVSWGKELRVATIDSAGRTHANPHILRPSFIPSYDAEKLTGAIAQVREAADGAEALDAAVAESGAQGTDFAGATFYFDHFMYGTGYCLLVPKDSGDDSAVAWDHYISRGYDEETKRPTDTVEVYRSPNLPVPPEEAAEILARATGIADPKEAAEFADRVGNRSLEIFRQRTGR